MPTHAEGRSPHGERGLKHQDYLEYRNQLESLSSRRAWIETTQKANAHKLYLRRSPHGERGLKQLFANLVNNNTKSLSSRRAWIETCYNFSAT